MDCGICMEKIDKDDIEHLVCGHYLCKCCLDRLTKDICPYCRTCFSKKKCEDKDTVQYLNETDNILPNSSLQSIINNNNITYDIIHYNRRQVKSRYDIRQRSEIKDSFVSNRDRIEPMRRKKKWKKRRNVIEA